LAHKEEFPVSDLLFVVATVVLFAILAIVVRAAEKL
jgi:hypothetical protein